MAKKTKNPIHSGAFFIYGLCTNSFLAYYEGFRDAYEKLPPNFNTGSFRIIGFYSIL